MSEEKRGRGRPGTYATAADRAKAWRARQKELIAEAQKPVEPVIVEKVVERVVEKRIPAAKANVAKAPDASKLFPFMESRFKGFGGEDNAKRFRTNAAKAATAARDVLALLQSDYSVTPIPETERAFLQQVAWFFDSLNGSFEVAQRKAKSLAAKAEREAKEKFEAQIKACILEMFGSTPDPAAVLAMAQDCLEFDKVADGLLKAQFRVDRAYFFLHHEYNIKAAIRENNVPKMTRTLAETRLDIGDRGRRWMDGEESRYTAGWNDFVEYRTNAKR